MRDGARIVVGASENWQAFLGAPRNKMQEDHAGMASGFPDHLGPDPDPEATLGVLKGSQSSLWFPFSPTRYRKGK